MGHSDLFSFPEQFQYDNKQLCSKRSRSKHHDHDLERSFLSRRFASYLFSGEGGLGVEEVIDKLFHNSLACDLELVFTMTDNT